VEVVYGIGDSNLTIHCQGFTFHVHRDVISQALEVWNNMLTGGFAESLSENISLLGDDANALKLSLDIIYPLLSGNIDPSRSQSSVQLKLFNFGQ
jgi:hypothetical protein